MLVLQFWFVLAGCVFLDHPHKMNGAAEASSAKDEDLLDQADLTVMPCVGTVTYFSSHLFAVGRLLAIEKSLRLADHPLTLY